MGFPLRVLGQSHWPVCVFHDDTARRHLTPLVEQGVHFPSTRSNRTAGPSAVVGLESAEWSVVLAIVGGSAADVGKGA